MGDFIYTNYKEPLTPNKSGFGYLGTVAHTKDGEFIQCYECGDLVKSLSTHVKKHKMKPKDYREKYQLNSKTPLCSPKFSDLKRKIYAERVATKLTMNKRKEAHRKWIESVKKNGQAPKKTSRTLEWHNKNGTCPDQIISRLKELGEISYDELAKNHSSLLNRLVRVYGSLNKARKIAGLTTRNQSTGHPPIKHTTASLLESLRDFYERYNRTPLSSDLRAENGLPPYSVYQRHFPTINHARLEAGVPLLIPVGNRQFVETMADNATAKELERIALPTMQVTEQSEESI